MTEPSPVANDAPYAARVRLRFTKQGPIRFLSHLDLLKCVERSLRRGAVPVAYTVGFHPRIRISFGPALALGHSSSAEWMDVDLAETVPPEHLMQRLNTVLPGGLSILSARDVTTLPPAPPPPALQAILRRAVYRVVVRVADGDMDLRRSISDLMNQEEIPLQKKNKRVNLRAFVDNIELDDSAPNILMVTLRLGPEGSVRPEDVLSALAPQATVTAESIERTALLALRNGTWQEP